MEERINGKIAKVLDKETVIINRGKKDGVAIDQRYLIYDDGEEIIDPESDESLGNLEITKGKVEIIDVKEKYSIARTYEKEFVNPLDYLSRPAGFARPLEKRKKLIIHSTDVNPEEYDLVVKVGDKVKQIIN